jgi:hypothetical protein
MCRFSRAPHFLTMTHPEVVNDIFYDFLTSMSSAASSFSESSSAASFSPTDWKQSLQLFGDICSRPEIGRRRPRPRQQLSSGPQSPADANPSVIGPNNYSLLRYEYGDDEKEQDQRWKAECEEHAAIVGLQDKFFDVLEAAEPERWEHRPRKYPWLPRCVFKFAALFPSRLAFAPLDLTVLSFAILYRFSQRLE